MSWITDFGGFDTNTVQHLSIRNMRVYFVAIFEYKCVIWWQPSQLSVHPSSWHRAPARGAVICFPDPNLSWRWTENRSILFLHEENHLPFLLNPILMTFLPGLFKVGTVQLVRSWEAGRNLSKQIKIETGGGSLHNDDDDDGEKVNWLLFLSLSFFLSPLYFSPNYVIQFARARTMPPQSTPQALDIYEKLASFPRAIASLHEFEQH